MVQQSLVSKLAHDPAVRARGKMDTPPARGMTVPVDERCAKASIMRILMLKIRVGVTSHASSAGQGNMRVDQVHGAARISG